MTHPGSDQRALILRPLLVALPAVKHKSPCALWTAKDVPLTALNPQDAMNDSDQQAWHVDPTPNLALSKSRSGNRPRRKSTRSKRVVRYPTGHRSISRTTTGS